MRLSELSVSELFALANVLLRIAQEIPRGDRRSAREAANEITYVLKLIAEKGERSRQPMPQRALN
jgi:hypothetical protein